MHLEVSDSEPLLEYRHVIASRLRYTSRSPAQNIGQATRMEIARIERQSQQNWALYLLVLTAVLASVALTWHSRTWGIRPWSIYALLLPVLWAVIFVHKRLDKLGTGKALAILACAMFCVDFCAVIAKSGPDVLTWLEQVIKSQLDTSFFADAVRLRVQPHWIATFQNQQLYLHSSTHPIGPVLYYAVLIDWLGPEKATIAAPILIAMMSSMTVFAMYFCSGVWTRVRKDRLFLCVLWALCPAVGLIFPEFDQIYPALTMVMLASAIYALEHDMRFGILLGTAFFVSTLFAYNLLVLGTFFVLIAAGYLWLKGWKRDAAYRLIGVVLVTLLVFVGMHVVFSLITGYHPVASFQHALHTQRLIEKRPHGLQVSTANLAWFSLGSGFLPEILCILYLLTMIKKGATKDLSSIATMAGIITLIMVELTGVLDYEAQRVWLFLQPFVFVPAALQLARFSFREQRIVLIAQWLVLATIGRSVVFIVLAK